MFRTRTLAIAAAGALILAACSSPLDTGTEPDAVQSSESTSSPGSESSENSGNSETVISTAALSAAPELKEAHSVDDVNLDSAQDVTLSGSMATTSADGVMVDGSTVTITVGGTYRLTGTFDGQIVVDTADKVALVLDGADITATDGAAISIVQSDEVTIYLAEGSTNALQDAQGNESGAALDSSEDLSITGTGTLNVVGTTNDGIASSDGLVIESGTINVTAADDGIRGKDYLVITGGEITVTARGGHALKSDNDEDTTVGYVDVQGGTVKVTSGEDGINSQTILISDGDLTIAAGDDGAHADLYLGITGGTVTITESEEGLEGAVIELAGGTIDITASDDGINAASSTSTAGDWNADPDLWVSFSGADVTVNAGGDGIDSNGNAYLSAGTLVISGPTSNGDGTIDVVGTFDVTGGEIAAAGSAGMAETPSASSSQSFVQANVTASAGSVVELRDSSGTTIASYTAEKSVQNVVFSNAQITAGETYTFLVDGIESATATAGQASGGAGGPGGGDFQQGPGGGIPSGPGGERPGQDL